MTEKHDRLKLSVLVDSNKPLTEKQWKNILSNFAVAIENCIAESETLTAQLGYVGISNPFNDDDTPHWKINI